MKISSKSGFAILISVILLAGCNIFSIHPLYKETDILTMDKVQGTWKNVKKENDYVIIKKAKDKAYDFTIIDGKDTLNYEMHMLKLADSYYLDLYPHTDCGFQSKNCEYLDNFFKNYVPMHTFMKFEIDKDQIKLTEFNIDRLEKLFKENKIRLAHEIPNDDYVIITASTDDLQKFIIKYSDDKEAFEEPTTYEKKI